MDLQVQTLIDYSKRETIETLKNTIAVGTTNDELALFIGFCRTTGLNPFKREVWCIKGKNDGRLMLMTGINGYLTVANRHPQFDGMEVEIEEDRNGMPVKAVAKVYRKDRKFPSVGIALMKEFRGNSPIWTKMPSIMLAKVAKSIAIREAFAIELVGSYTEEEIPEMSAPTAPIPSATPQSNGAAVVGELLPKEPPPHDPRRYYDLAKALEGKTEQEADNLKNWLASKGGNWIEDTKLWEMPVRVSKLDPYEVKIEAA